MNISAPKQITLIISVAIAIFAAIVHWGHIAIPQLHTGFVVLLVGYLILLAGNLVDGV